MTLRRAGVATALAVMLFTGCRDPSMTSVLIVVDDVPLAADGLAVNVSHSWNESSTILGDDVAPIAPGGRTSFALLVPSAADSIDVSVTALAAGCRVAHAESACSLRQCDELVMSLVPVALDSCGEPPDAGPPLDDGRDAAGDPQ